MKMQPLPPPESSGGSSPEPPNYCHTVALLQDSDRGTPKLKRVFSSKGQSLERLEDETLLSIQRELATLPYLDDEAVLISMIWKPKTLSSLKLKWIPLRNRSTP